MRELIARKNPTRGFQRCMGRYTYRPRRTRRSSGADLDPLLAAFCSERFRINGTFQYAGRRYQNLPESVLRALRESGRENDRKSFSPWPKAITGSGQFRFAIIRPTIPPAARN